MRLSLLLGVMVIAAACHPGKPAARLKPQDVLGSGAASGFARAIEAPDLHFPRDHGAHPRFRTEWWYLTGHLRSGEREFGYQVSLFRFGLRPRATAGRGWEADQIYLAHFAVSDLMNGGFHAAERLSRGAAGLAGSALDKLDVWVEDIAMNLTDGVLQVRGGDGGYRLELRLQATGGLVAHGDSGLSRKGPAPGNASYYYSIPRLAGGGVLELPEGRFEVSGSGWLDREWSTGSLAAEQVGWDWFALQLDDGSELMLYRLRDRNPQAQPFSAGTFVTAGGEPRALAGGDIHYRVDRRWRSPLTGARYPLGWRIEIPALGLNLGVEALADDQELDLSFRYWEGAARVTGERHGKPLAGRAYLELTGY